MMYGVATTAQMHHGDHPDLEKIRFILRTRVAHGSDGTKYFELMLKVLANGGFLMEEILPASKNLFDQQRLADYKRALMNVDGIPFFGGSIGRDLYFWV
jgi:hypothetical protein